MRIAMFYYSETLTNAHGKLDREIMSALSVDHDLTVFAVEFDNPDPSRISFVRVPSPTRPLVVLFVAFHIIAPLVYAFHRLRYRVKFDVVHFHDVDLPFGDVAYVQFCNRAYLNEVPEARERGGTRLFLRYMEHRLRSLAEPLVFRRVKRIVAGSEGLANELRRYFSPSIARKLTVIPNFADVDLMRRPPDFDAGGIRSEIDVADDDLLAVFVALGHYERKGLPAVFDALACADHADVKLLVVGGTSASVRAYEARAQELGIRGRVRFVPTQSDIRPYLWASDLFVFPSRYEVFPLVVLEAAASGLPIIATPVNGIVDILEHGVNGWQVQPDDGKAIAGHLEHARANRDELRARGEAAARSAASFGADRFRQSWSAFYEPDRFS